MLEKPGSRQTKEAFYHLCNQFPAQPPLRPYRWTVRNITRGSKEGPEVREAVPQRVLPPHPALVCHQRFLIFLCSRNCQVFFSSSQVHPPTPLPGGIGSTCLPAFVTRPLPPPRRSCRLPPTCLPSSRSPSSRALPVARLARPLVPSLPPFRTGQRKEKGGSGCVHYFY